MDAYAIVGESKANIRLARDVKCTHASNPYELTLNQAHVSHGLRLLP